MLDGKTVALGELQIDLLLLVERAGAARRKISLGIERALMATERTMLAWNRASASLIYVDFCIHKAFALRGCQLGAAGQLDRF